MQIVKNTSLTAIIGFTDLTRAAQLIDNVTFQPFLAFGWAAAIYFALCFPMSLLARNLDGGFMPVVEVQSVSKSFGATRVLDDVSFDVERGNVLVLIGRSGSGKSTILRCLNGLESVDAGTIRVGDFAVTAPKANLRALRQEIGIVFQHYNLFPHLTVERNITLALTVVKRLSIGEARAIAQRVLAQVGLAEKTNAFPEQLSGWPATACRHRAIACRVAESHAVRRGDVGARSRTERLKS